MKIHKTTNDNYIVETKLDGKDVVFKFNSELDEYEGSESDIGEITTTLRANSSEYKACTNVINKILEQKSDFQRIDNILWCDVLLNKEDFSLHLNINGDIRPATKEQIEGLRANVGSLVMAKRKATDICYEMGDRVLLFWPTGTGKTYTFLDAVKELKKKGEIEDSYICTITEGMEDIDFLARIVPTETGITYHENSVVTLLREASKGKKVAILLDELNRGSKSFLNLVLKLLDAVDGKFYTLNNFINNEIIQIPIENVLFVATMNLGGKYVGTTALDEALLDRFNFVQEKSYDLEVEKSIIKNFGAFEKQVEKIVEATRNLYKEGEIRSPISTRGIKVWAEKFVKTGKTEQDLFGTFSKILLHRIVTVDDFGLVNEADVSVVISKFKEIGINF